MHFANLHQSLLFQVNTHRPAMEWNASKRYLRWFYAAMPNMPSMKGALFVLGWLVYVAALWAVLIYRDRRERDGRT